MGEGNSDSVVESKPVEGGRSKHYWLDVLNLGGGDDFGVAGVQFNFSAKDAQWMASYRVLDQDFLFRHRVERGSQQAIEGEMSELGLIGCGTFLHGAVTLMLLWGSVYYTAISVLIA